MMKFSFHFAIFILHFAFCNFHFLSAAELTPIDGKPLDAELIGAAADGRMEFHADGRKISMSAADLVRWGHCPGQGRAGGLLSDDGSWIAARVLSADQKKLTAESNSFGVFSMPFDSLTVIAFTSPLPLAGEGAGVRAVLKNGDVLPGRLLGIEKNVVKLQTDLGDVEISADRINAILLPIKPRPAAAPRSLRVWIGLNDGSLLSAEKLVVKNGSATFTAVGRTWKTPVENIVFLQPLGGRATYLSDLAPAEYEQTPYLDPPWPWRADRNVAGGRLTVGGKHFMKGIGVHGAARLVYKIGEEQGGGANRIPKRFQALVAIDDSTNNRGSVRFRVLVDGQEKYAGPIVRGGDKPRPVDVDITGAKRLELVVDYADRADVLDHADWLEARIVVSRDEG